MDKPANRYDLTGLAGHVQFGARTRQHINQRVLKIGLAVVLTSLAAGYVIQYFH